MASGDTLFTLLPRNSVPTKTVYATQDTIEDGSTVKGLIPVLDFAGATADENAEWTRLMPSKYSGGGLTVKVQYAMAGTVGTAVEFEVRVIQMVAADAIGSQDLGSQTPVLIVDTPDGTANVLDVTPAGELSHANAGSPVAGDYVRIRLSRDYDHAVNADDAQVVAVYVTET